jgi:hypothetical protein
MATPFGWPCYQPAAGTPPGEKYRLQQLARNPLIPHPNSLRSALDCCAISQAASGSTQLAQAAQM